MQKTKEEAPKTRRTLISLKRIGFAILTLMSVSGAHYIGFMLVVPEGLQRLMAMSLASSLSVVFLYYVGIAAIGARVGAYVAISLGWAVAHALTRIRVISNPRLARSYMRSVFESKEGVEIVTFLAFPFLVALQYIGLSWAMLWSALGFILLTTLLAAARLPHLSLNPSVFKSRFWNFRRWKFWLDVASEFAWVAAITLVAFAFVLGQLRFSRLANGPRTTLYSSEYSGPVIVLIRSDKGMLLLEKAPTSKDRRFIYYGDGYMVSETIPSNSAEFPVLPPLPAKQK